MLIQNHLKYTHSESIQEMIKTSKMIVKSLKTSIMEAIGGPRGVTAGDIPTHEVMQIKINKTPMMKTYLL